MPYTQVESGEFKAIQLDSRNGETDHSLDLFKFIFWLKKDSRVAVIKHKLLCGYGYQSHSPPPPPQQETNSKLMILTKSGLALKFLAFF